MNRIVLANLSSVKGMNRSEMKAVAGGQFIGTFSNWYPPKKRCYATLGGRLYPTKCPPYYPPLR